MKAFTEKEDKIAFIEELQEKQSILEKKLASTPNAVHTDHLKFRMKSDIHQLQWRLKNLRLYL